MEDPYQDKKGHFTDEENDGGECHHDNPKENAAYNSQESQVKKLANKIVNRQIVPKLHIDYEKDNVFPKLREEDLKKTGASKNKQVLLKKGIIDRNFLEHNDLTKEDFEVILSNCLYSPSEVFLANKKKPYYHFAKVIENTSFGKSEIGLILIDVDETKDYFEIVHIHYVNENGLARAKNKIKKD